MTRHRRVSETQSPCDRVRSSGRLDSRHLRLGESVTVFSVSDLLTCALSATERPRLLAPDLEPEFGNQLHLARAHAGPADAANVTRSDRLIRQGERRVID